MVKEGSGIVHPTTQQAISTNKININFWLRWLGLRLQLANSKDVQMLLACKSRIVSDATIKYVFIIHRIKMLIWLILVLFTPDNQLIKVEWPNFLTCISV